MLVAQVHRSAGERARAPPEFPGERRPQGHHLSGPLARRPLHRYRRGVLLVVSLLIIPRVDSRCV